MEPDIELAWNLRSANGPVDKVFRGGKPPPRSIVKQVNYVDNPFFPEALQDAAPQALQLQLLLSKQVKLTRGQIEREVVRKARHALKRAGSAI